MKCNTNYFGFLWHAVFLAVTVTFTEINTILPAMVIQVGGSEIHIGIMAAIVVGVPLFAIIIGWIIGFAGYVPVFTAASVLSIGSIVFISRLKCPVDRKPIDRM